MTRVRIKGLVRAARLAQDELLGGVAPEKRAAFLQQAARVVAQADTMLRTARGCADDLPAPSRGALAELRRIAALRPDEIPATAGNAPPRKRVRVTNVVRTLDSFLEDLAYGDADASQIRDTRLEAQMAANAVAAICAESGSHTAGLPAPSRKAYAMLRWLSLPGNCETYDRQVRRALRAWNRCQPLIGPSDDVMVSFGPWRTRLRRGVDDRSWRLSAGYLDASEDDLVALIQTIILRAKASADTREQHRALVDSEAYAALTFELEQLADPVPFRAKGVVHDLDVLFQRLDERFFRGTLTKPPLHWQRTLSRRVFGLYVPSLDLVGLNPILDDPGVPAFVPEVVLYHELLHKKHGARLVNGRRLVHTPAFKAEERRHPRLAESDAWLAALATNGTPPRSRP